MSVDRDRPARNASESLDVGVRPLRPPRPAAAGDEMGARVVRRFNQLVRVWNARGASGASHLLRARLASAIAPTASQLPVNPGDVVAADLDRAIHRTALDHRAGDPMIVNWVMTPPAVGSGGHTTIFRIVNFLESRGHVNRVYFYDVHLTDHAHYRSIVRDYFGFDGPIGDVDRGMDDAHVVLATGWPTAYPVYAAAGAGVRCYFVQDFEPGFHPTSALSVLAENTYRMGFHAITAGAWLAETLRGAYGMSADSFGFGCDVRAYVRDPCSARTGVAFYVRPEAPRRASELGLMALEVFARRQPGVEIHLYGERIGRQAFAFVDHGRVTPQQLNRIYNRCRAGLSLSLTNVSLVPYEMLAAGCIPVVNDARQNRVVLDNAYVRYAALTPHALARELEALVTMEGFDTLSSEASASVRSRSWETAGAAVEAAFRRLLAQRHDGSSVPANAREARRCER